MFEAAIALDTASTIERETRLVDQLRRSHRDRRGQEEIAVDAEPTLLTQVWQRVISRRHA